MNTLIELLNHLGGQALKFAWPMLWQSSLLIAALFMLDFVLRRKVRAAVRYALWLVVLVKLLLPPTLALPTSLAWWVRPSAPSPPVFQTKPFVVTYGPELFPAFQNLPALQPSPPPVPRLSAAAAALLAGIGISLGLFAWMLWRWQQVIRHIRRTETPPAWLNDLLAATKRQAGLRGRIRLRLTDQAISPAVCGLFRPLVMLPAGLAEQLPQPQLRAVLLHELVHLRRADVWVNCAQTLLQIAYWWHPLLWLANARIRRLREEAVDDAVMLALRDEAEIYAPTLLEVAKLAFHRPLASLGLVGILESKRALRHRIERLLDFQPPRRAGLTVVSMLGILAFTCLAVPQGEAPPKAAKIPEPQNSPAAKLDEANTHEPEKTNEIWEIEALSPDGKVQYDTATGLTTCTKGVRIKYGETVLTADQAIINQKTSEVIAEGNVRIRRGDKTQEAKRIHFHLNEAFTDLTNVGNTSHVPRNIAGSIRPSRAQMALRDKLAFIRLNRVAFENLSLEQVIKVLREESKQQDPEKQGVNFILNTIPPSGSASAERADLASLRVTLKTPLSNACLKDVISAITEVADKPIGYSVMDNAVMFSFVAKRWDPSELMLRTFRVDPNTFIQGLASVSSFAVSNADSNVAQSRLYHDLNDLPGVMRLARTNDTSAIVAAFRGFMQSRGVNLDPPKNVLWNQRQGTLLVSATMKDLDKVEVAIQTFNVTQPQIEIKGTFVAIPTKAIASFWKSIGITNAASKPETIILTSTQAVAVLNVLKSQKGTDILSQSSVTTLSGRQAQIQVTDIQTVVTQVTNGLKEPEFITEKVPCGPVLDLIPTVAADGWVIELTTVATLNAFLGYDQPRKDEWVDVLVGGKPTRVKPPLPRFRSTTMNSKARVGDGQTLVLGNPDVVEISSGRVVKPLPKSKAVEKTLLVFVTPTLIDAAGNPYHATEQSPIPKTK